MSERAISAIKTRRTGSAPAKREGQATHRRVRSASVLQPVRARAHVSRVGCSRDALGTAKPRVAAQLRSAADRQSTPVKIAPPGFLGTPAEPRKSQLLTILTPATMPVLRVHVRKCRRPRSCASPPPPSPPSEGGRPTAKGDVLCQCPQSPQWSSREDCPRNQILSPLRWGAVSMSPIASAVFARRSTSASTSLPLAKGETEGVGTHSIFAVCVARNGSSIFLFKKKYPESGQSLPA